MKKQIILLGVIALFSASLLADSVEVTAYHFKDVEIWPNFPGCKMSFYDEETLIYKDDYGNVKPGFIGYNPTTGNPYTVYRNGEAIATRLTTGGKNEFTDLDVVPGETYNYKIRASRGAHTATVSFEQTCYFIYRVEFNSSELSFKADGGNANKQDVVVSIYTQTSDSCSITAFDNNGISLSRSNDWIGYSFDFSSSHILNVWVASNETGLPREGSLTISYNKFPCTLRIVQAAKEVSYSSWAEANGLNGSWNTKDDNGIYNVFRYAFGVPTGQFTETPLIDIKFVDGKPTIKTPTVVNTSGFTLSVEASDKADGTGNTANYPLNASGETVIEDDVKPSRFFRLKAVQH